MFILRGILAIIAGYTVMIVLVLGTTLTIRAFLPEISEKPTPVKYALLILVYVTLFGVVAGFVTGSIAQREQVIHTVFLGFLLSLFAMLSIVSASRAGDELWFPVVNCFLQFLSVIAGGYLSSLNYKQH